MIQKRTKYSKTGRWVQFGSGRIDGLVDFCPAFCTAQSEDGSRG